MQAIILAAGMGKRLGQLTRENTKCMVEVGGVRLVERVLRILDKKGLSRIIMVVGYQYENLMTFVNKLDISTPIDLSSMMCTTRQIIFFHWLWRRNSLDAKTHFYWSLI